jgi:DnaJ-class molecular chaperone
MMTNALAGRMLGIDPLIATEATVRKAYAQAVMADHPDRGGDGTLISRLQLARDVLLGIVPGAFGTPCNLCKGVGKIRARFGVQTCTACEGSGDQK